MGYEYIPAAETATFLVPGGNTEVGIGITPSKRLALENYLTPDPLGFYRIRNVSRWRVEMAKIKFTLHGVAREIRKAEQKLRSLRPKVVDADQKKIDVNLRELERSYKLISIICPKEKPQVRIVPFGQWFQAKPRKEPRKR